MSQHKKATPASPEAKITISMIKHIKGTKHYQHPALVISHDRPAEDSNHPDYNAQGRGLDPDYGAKHTAFYCKGGPEHSLRWELEQKDYALSNLTTYGFDLLPQFDDDRYIEFEKIMKDVAHPQAANQAEPGKKDKDGKPVIVIPPHGNDRYIISVVKTLLEKKRVDKEKIIKDVEAYKTKCAHDNIVLAKEYLSFLTRFKEGLCNKKEESSHKGDNKHPSGGVGGG